MSETLCGYCQGELPGCYCGILRDRDALREEVAALRAKVDGLERTVRLMSGGGLEKRSYPVMRTAEPYEKG